MAKRLAEAEEYEVPAIVPYMQQKRWDRGTEPITEIPQDEGWKEYQDCPCHAMAPEVRGRKQ